MGSYIMIMYFTGRHWLLLAPSKLQSSPAVFIEGYQRILKAAEFGEFTDASMPSQTILA